MTFPFPPPHSESLRFVAQASRPGSIESRHVHGCTCTEDPDRSRVWNPEHVETWQASLSLDCPAHGRLLERHIERVNASMGHSQGTTRAALDELLRHDFGAGLFGDVARLGLPRVPPPPRRRSGRTFPQRVRDAWGGMWRGWRGC